VKTLLVIAHPRPNALTHAYAHTFAEAAGGHSFEVADLYAEGFDPSLPPEDEPDWNAPKTFSPAVQAEMARIERNEATVMVYPVWWWSMPALLKGWIDRVWNRGWAYGGGARFPQRRVWCIGLAGGDAASFAKRGYDRAMQVQIEVGILQYCGVAEARHEVIYGTLEGKAAVAAGFARMQELGREFQGV
jgi:NAD(P)H dehydrogenase (quinone)